MFDHGHADDDDGTASWVVVSGALAGAVAGALIAQRVGTLRGLARTLRRRRRFLFRLARAAVPDGTIAALLQSIDLEGLLAPSRPRRPGQRPRRAPEPDPELDELDVDPPVRTNGARRAEDPVATSPEDVPEDAPVAEDAPPPAPEELERRVLRAFRRHSVLRSRAIEIAVGDDQTVELTGWVRRALDIRIARRVAREVSGVRRVWSRLEIGAPASRERMEAATD
jgi:BON domain